MWVYFGGRNCKLQLEVKQQKALHKLVQKEHMLAAQHQPTWQ